MLFLYDQIILISAPQLCPNIWYDEVIFSRETREKHLKNDVHQDATLSTMRYNRAIHEMCLKAGCLFADPTDDLFDYQTREVKKYFWTNEPSSEMHCSPKRIYYFYHRAIQRAIQAKWCGV